MMCMELNSEFYVRITAQPSWFTYGPNFSPTRVPCNSKVFMILSIMTDSIQDSLFLSDSSMVVSLIWFVTGCIFYEKDRKPNDFENEVGYSRLWKFSLILRTDSCIIGAWLYKKREKTAHPLPSFQPLPRTWLAWSISTYTGCWTVATSTRESGFLSTDRSCMSLDRFIDGFGIGLFS